MIFTPFFISGHPFASFAGSSSFHFLKSWCSAGFSVLCSTPSFHLPQQAHLLSAFGLCFQLLYAQQTQISNLHSKNNIESRVMWTLMIFKNVQVNFVLDRQIPYCLCCVALSPNLSSVFLTHSFVILRSYKWTSRSVWVRWLLPIYPGNNYDKSNRKW